MEKNECIGSSISYQDAAKRRRDVYSLMEFPYLLRKDRRYPIIPIVLHQGEGVLKTEALVDFGANISVFSSDIADYLGIVLTSGKKIYLQGIGGRIVGYIHKVQLSVGNNTFICPIVFSAELVTSFNIIGREGFFTKFVIVFNETKNKLLLKSSKSTRIQRK